MRRLLTTIVGATALMLSGIQHSEAQNTLKLRTEASLNFSYMDNQFLSWSDFKSNSIAGYRVGASVDVPLSGLLVVSPGLAVVSKGTNTTIGRLLSDMSTESFKVRTHYLQLPVYIGLRVPLVQSVAFSVLAGPYFSYALHSEATVSEQGNNVTYKDMIRTGWNNIKTQQYDLGLGATVRLDLSRLYFTVGADFGGLKAFKDADKADKLKNTTLNFGLGLHF